MHACRYSNTDSNIETVKMLLEYGPDINEKDNYGSSSLLYACDNLDSNSNIETVKILLENGADIDTKDIINGDTALILTCMTSYKDSNIEIVKLLLENGADPNLKNNNGSTALMMSCRHDTADSNLGIIKLLLNQNNIDVNITTILTKYNALMLLCQHNPNQYEIAKLLKSKTNLNHTNYQNEKIEDICLDEYKYLFVTTLDDILQKYEIIKFECFICNEDDADCIKCKFDHFTCTECLPKVKFNCEACRNSF